MQPTLLEFAATGNGSQSVAVTATNTEWTHEVSGAAQEWLSASLGEDGKSLLISVTDNPTAEKRSGTVSVKAVDHIEIKPIGITVQQEAGEGVQPGGSIRDQQVIDTCNKYGIAMAFTGMRLFHH